MESPPDEIDPKLVQVATSLRADADDATFRPYVVGVVGSVAVGKSVTAGLLAHLLGEPVEVVSTDVFLFPNARMEPLGGAMRKGYPDSFDWVALDAFLGGLRSGSDRASVPVYSHEEFDIVAGEVRTFEVPDVVIIEGLNLLQDAPAVDGRGPIRVADHLDRSIYLDAETAMIEEWFVQRFVSLARPAMGEPSDFYRMFAAMSDAELDASARWVWTEINEPNLRQHIAPTKARADMVVHKGPAHEIEWVTVRG